MPAIAPSVYLITRCTNGSGGAGSSLKV